MAGRVRQFPNPRLAVEYLKRRSLARNIFLRHEQVDNDLEWIRNQRRNQVVLPLPLGHDQEAWFSKLESNAIWEKVFKFLTNPSDMTSAYLSCEMFRKHLEYKRKMALLPKVFGVLRDTGYLVFDKPKHRQDVLNQRLVSKAWKKAAEDEFLVAPAMGLVKSRPGQESDVLSPNEAQYSFKGIYDVVSASEALGITKSGAGLMRSVEIDDQSCWNKENFYGQLSDFLDIHGDNVWSLTFNFHPGDDASPEFNYVGLWNAVSRMPNLQEIFIKNPDFSDGDEDAKARLHQMMNLHPFPCIPSLKSCNFVLVYNPNPSIVTEILKRNSASVKSISLGWLSFGPNGNIPDLVWSALGNLSLEYFSFTETCIGQDNAVMDHLHKLGQLDWPLKTLHLCCMEDPVNLDASRVLEVFNRFESTLEDMEVSGSIRLENDDRNVSVNFPVLKKIHFPLA